VQGVEHGLVAGIGVHGGHEAALDADGVVEHLGDRRQAIGGARRIGDHLVAGFELIVVDAIDHGHVGIARRGRDQHFARARFEMLRRRLALGEDAGALERHVDTELAPGQLGRVALGGHLDRPAADIDAVAAHRYVVGITAVDRVVAQQVRIGLDRAQVVDADHLYVVAPGLRRGAQNQPADTAEPVDGNPNRQANLP